MGMAVLPVFGIFIKSDKGNVQMNMSFTKRLYKERYGYIFTAPALIFFTIFYIYPIFDAIKTSLYDFRAYTVSWVGFGNYADILKDDVFLKSLINTCEIVIMNVPANLIFGLLIAMMINRWGKKAQGFFKGAFYIPAVTSVVSLTLTWQYILDYDFGFLNYFFRKIGIGKINYLSESSALITTTLIVFTMCLGGNIIILAAALDNIPAYYYEAADIDGAGAWKKLWSITLPLMKPSLLYVLVMGTIGSFQMFAIILLFTGGGPNYATSTILLLLYQEAFVHGNFGRSCAMAVILSVIIILLAVVQFKTMKSDVEY